MVDWGWRVPFLLGALLGPVGIYMRRTIDETPAYEQARQAAAPAGGRSGFALGARAFGFTIVWTVCFYMLLDLHAELHPEVHEAHAAAGAVVEHDRPGRAGDRDSDHGPRCRTASAASRC